MRKLVLVLLGLVLGLGAGLGAAAFYLGQKAKPAPDAAAVLTQMREVARLETLELTLYKKIAFSPDPPPAGDSTWKNVLSWARYNLREPHGRAILFAKVHLGLDLSKLDPAHVRISRDQVWLVLPPVAAQVELLPGETEIIDSNLDSAETAQLLAVAKDAFARQVEADPALRERARQSAERALRGLFAQLGFARVNVVAELPATPPS